MTDTKHSGYVQAVPDKCDRITWRGSYYHLPLTIQQQVAPQQVAGKVVHQFRKQHCAEWYDGHADHSDGRGPYEERTLYTSPQQEAQEPVAWYEYNADLDAWFLAYSRNPKAKTRPLVFGDTAPQSSPASRSTSKPLELCA